MTAHEARAVLDHWQERLGLRLWTINAEWVPQESLEDGSLGECGEWRDYAATMRVATRATSARETVIHEAIHCLVRDTVYRAFATVTDDLSEPVADMAEKGWLVQEERLVRTLEELLVRLPDKA